MEALDKGVKYVLKKTSEQSRHQNDIILVSYNFLVS